MPNFKALKEVEYSQRYIINLFTSGAKLARTGAGTFFENTREIELVVKANIATYGGNGHTCGTQ